MNLLILILFLFAPSDSDITNDVFSYLKAHLNGYKKFEYEMIKIPSNYSEIKILADKEFKIKGEIGYIPVKLTKNKRTALSYISVRLKLYNSVFIAVRDIERKEPLDKIDFENSLKNITGLSSAPILDLKDIHLFRSKMGLNKGEILTENDIERIPLIHIGDRITASIVNGNVMIQTDVVSKQEGSAGDIISVSASKNKIFKARVLDNNNVLIIE